MELAMTIPSSLVKEAAVVKGFLKVAQAAKRLEVSRRTIVRWIETGHLPATKLNPKVDRSPYMVPIQAIEAIEKERETPWEDQGE